MSRFCKGGFTEIFSKLAFCMREEKMRRRIGSIYCLVMVSWFFGFSSLFWTVGGVVLYQLGLAWIASWVWIQLKWMNSGGCTDDVLCRLRKAVWMLISLWCWLGQWQVSSNKVSRLIESFVLFSWYHVARVRINFFNIVVS